MIANPALPTPPRFHPSIVSGSPTPPSRKRPAMTQPSRLFRTLLCIAAIAAASLVALAACHRTQPLCADEMRERAFALIEEGRAFEAKKDYRAAVEVYQQALALSPRPAIHYSLGHCYAELGDYARAEEYLNNALQMQIDYTEARYELQRVLDLKAQTAHGATTAEKPAPVQPAPPQPIEPTIVAQADPAPPEAPASEPALAPEPIQTPASAPKPSPAPPSYEEIHKTLFPGSSKRRNEEYESELGDNPATRSMAGNLGYQGGSAIALNTYAYHLDKAKGFLQIKEHDKAIKELLKALSLKPGDIEALLALGDAYAATRRNQAAMDQYRAAIQANPRDPRPHFKIGNVYSKEKNPESLQAARKAYLDAIGLDPQYQSAYFNLGVLAMQSQNTDEAISYLEKVVQMDSNHVNAHLYLGILYGDYRNNNAKAIEHYQQYLDLGGSRAAEVRRWMKALAEKEK